jgi:hypothetical protein
MAMQLANVRENEKLSFMVNASASWYQCLKKYN